MKRSVLILLVFSAISFVATLLPRYLERNKLLQGIKSVRSEQEQEVKQGFGDSGNRNGSMLLLMRRQVEEIERLKSSPGSESEVVLDSISEIVKEMISVYSEYESARIKVLAALEFRAINSHEGIGKSIERAKKAEIAAREMVRLNSEMGAKLKEYLAGSQEPPSDTDLTMQGFYRTADIGRRGKLYKLSAEIMKDAKSALQVVEKEWGAWEYNVEGGGVLFESESAVIEFNDALAQIGILVQKAEELQLMILKAQAGDSS
ncbi:MAG: hypothetical protein R2568_05660 [Candidatus Scalindua sp.]|jgi:hypothetical protein|nr:hypothetical protein [Candidatus Scalindua sp.]MDV5166218.1 hypothetical protein [Candidatus Scalindua sp.]